MKPAVCPTWATTAQPIQSTYLERWPGTCGNYATEAEAAAAFDSLVPTDLFVIHREVTGRLAWPLYGQGEATRVRIDRVLQPTDTAIKLGWACGYIGVELKRSGEKVGRAISQMLDYLRSTFQIDGQKVTCSHVALFPYEGPDGGPLESMFYGQRLACAYEAYDGRLHMYRPGVASNREAHFLIKEDLLGLSVPGGAAATTSLKVGSR